MAKKNGYKAGDIPQGNGNYMTGKKIPGKTAGFGGGKGMQNDAMVGFAGGKKMSKIPGFGGKAFSGNIPQPKGYAKDNRQFTGSTKSLKNILLKG